MDSCGYNIFEINNFLHQLNPENDEIDLKQFLILIFYIYKMQVLPSDDDTIRSGISEISDMTIKEINDFSGKSQEIYMNRNNIIKIILDQRDRRPNPYNYLCPDFNSEDVRSLLEYELLDFCGQYMKAIEMEIFDKYAVVYPGLETIKKPKEDNKKNETENKELEFLNNENGDNTLKSKKNKDKKELPNPILEHREKTFKILNIVNLNTLIFKLPIFKNFDSGTITTYLKMFLEDIQDDSFNIIKAAFDEEFKEEEKEKKIKDIFNEVLLNASELNFSYSGISLLLIQFAVKLPSSQGHSLEDAVVFMFESEFQLRPDAETIKEILQEEESEEPDYDFIPESATLLELKEGKKNLEEDKEIIDDLLSRLEKDLPEMDKIIMQFANDKPQHSNTIFNNPFHSSPPKFPLERLQVEIDEEAAARLAANEQRRIAKAKKAKRRNARDAPPKEFYWDPVPDKKEIDEKYMGKEKVGTLQFREVKNSFKEIIGNTKVYPGLIRETLILPKTLPEKIKELIINSYQDITNGLLEMAVRRLERAEFFLKDYSVSDTSQIDLFFRLTFGYLYQELGYSNQAIKYYYLAKQISDKLLDVDPDKALVYCYLGALFLDLKELIWSTRCFLKAKEIRERVIGGDTLDTAAIYNNLGVLSFHLESYLPAKGYFELAYEITKGLLGPVNPRTIYIKRNISKLDYLSFNKTVSFKTLGLYPVPPQMIQNPKKKKKGKK